MSTETTNPVRWIDICGLDELTPNVGTAALVAGEQVAIFLLPPAASGAESSPRPEIYAVGNHDPFGGANVISRGIVGDLNGEAMVASPLYKQHFRLADGHCLEDDRVRLPVWPIRVVEGRIEIGVASAE
ncbi:MAG: nitrite reductase small subunit NirD [Gammaproteobacteria bacterium]|nr:nitrite reductase small subunit NirD [Gammaproteobacteria bacterium]